MNDMSSVIVPKSDQINADDLISGPMTITIAEVRIKRGDEQPVDIYFEGSPKAYRPCKSMSRVLVAIWGPDAGQYLGRSLTLYRDPNVRFGKDAVGGIRISHMTDIPESKLDNGKVVMSLTATRAQRKPHVVKPLQAPARQAAADPARVFADAYIAKVRACETSDMLNAYADDRASKLADLEAKRPELHTECVHALNLRREELAFAADEGPATQHRGEAFSDDGMFGDDQ
jgi:hypothetical protein